MSGWTLGGENHTNKASCCNWRALGLIDPTPESHTPNVGL